MKTSIVKHLHQCNICHKKFTESSGLKRHARIHTGEQPFQCNNCLMKFDRLFSLKRHTLRKHKIGKWFTRCVFCNKGFQSNSAAAFHVRAHIGEKPFSCKLCGKEFETQQSKDVPAKDSRNCGKRRLNKETGNVDIISSVKKFMGERSGVLVISTFESSITSKKLIESNIHDMTVSHNLDDFVTSPNPVKALVCNENYDIILIVASEMKEKVVLVITETEEKINVKIKELFGTSSKIQVVSDNIEWKDFTPAMKFQTLQNWKKRFGYCLKSNLLKCLKGQFLIDLVNGVNIMIY